MKMKHSDYRIGDIVRGLKLVSLPYKINGKKDYRVMVKCMICDKEPYEIILSEIKRHTYDGCSECAKKQRFKTHDKFIEQMKAVNSDIIITGKYISDNNKIECKCSKCGYEFSSLPSNLLQGHGCRKCANVASSMRQRKSHEEFVSSVNSILPNIKVIGTYTRSQDTVRCKCLLDGYEWDAWPNHLIKGHGCPVCAGRQVFAGYNDIATLRPDLVKYFINKDEAKKFTVYSNQYTDLMCPYCGHTKNMLIKHLSKTGFACPICGDGVSYPNKFCRQVLRQLPITNLQCEYSSDWTESFLYDNYFEYNGIKYIVEVDGIQHFQYTSGNWTSLDVVKQIDDAKTKLATNNECVVIRIDCQKSEMHYIKNSILNSSLSDIFDLSDIDWIACEEASRSSLIYEVCNFYNNTTNKKIKNIANVFALSGVTIRKYLRIGTDLNMCNFTI
jgi:hypothetical protein